MILDLSKENYKHKIEQLIVKIDRHLESQQIHIPLYEKSHEKTLTIQGDVYQVVANIEKYLDNLQINISARSMI